MEIQLTNLSKKFVNNLLFKDLSYSFHSNNIYAVTGANGSGKSTLLKIVSGYSSPTKGEVKFFNESQEISKDNQYQHVNICAPYLNLIDDFTLREHLAFHHQFKKILADINITEEIEKANLISSMDKAIKEFSSGMQQRVKLILATCYQSDILLLDEPTSHLDNKGKEWYLQLKRKFDKRITIIFSNDKAEFESFTEKIINIDN